MFRVQFLKFSAMEVSSSLSFAERTFWVHSFLEAMAVDTVLAAGKSLLCLLMLTGSLLTDINHSVSPKLTTMDGRFPFDELRKGKHSYLENKGSDTDDDDEEEEDDEDANDQDDEGGDEDFSGEEGEEEADPEDDPEANGARGSDGDDDDDDDGDEEDDDDGEDEDDEEDGDEEEDEDEEEVPQPPSKKRK